MRVQEVKDNLIELLSEELLQNVPLLVFANKQDLEMALDASEVSILNCGVNNRATFSIGDGAFGFKFNF